MYVTTVYFAFRPQARAFVKSPKVTTSERARAIAYYLLSTLPFARDRFAVFVEAVDGNEGREDVEARSGTATAVWYPEWRGQ